MHGTTLFSPLAKFDLIDKDKRHNGLNIRLFVECLNPNDPKIFSFGTNRITEYLISRYTWIVEVMAMQVFFFF